jgi:glycine cleavage system H lipoate-binding protein
LSTTTLGWWLTQDSPFDTLESAKSASDLNSSGGGEALKADQELSGEIGLMSKNCYSEGWGLKMKGMLLNNKFEMVS